MLRQRIGFFIVVPLLLLGCSSTQTMRVGVPPRVDLRQYPAVGLVTFSSSGADAELERLSTQRFLQAVQEAQPGTHVVELGPETQVLASVHGRSWDAATLRAIKEAHGVDANVLGRLDVQKARPNVEFSSSSIFKALDVRADVKASLTARMVETASAATTWTDSSQLTTNVASANMNNRGRGTFGVRDPQDAYAGMVDHLVCDITDAFRVHYVTRTVPRDQLQTASAGD